MTTELPTILYIEDNYDNQRLVQRVLGARGYNVVLAEDGPEGLARARELQPVLILVDLNIPGLNGYETTTRLRSLAHLAEVPIIALTADGMPGSRERALVAGCNGYLVKPIDTRRLPQQIAEFINGRREAVSAPSESILLREYNQSLVERLEMRVRELSIANAELQEVDRLKSQFLSTLSHELRTPLTSLLGYLELFGRGTLGTLSEAQREAVNVMRRSAELLSRQLNNLLYFQELRSSQLRRMPVRLHERVSVLVAELRQQALQTNVQLEALLGETQPVLADMMAMDTSIRHLIDNGIKFTAPGGRVKVTLHDEPARLILRVEDTGIGIAREYHEKIFLPFYQIDTTLARPYTGSGLGLAIVRHVIEAHGGQVSVRSAPGKGSVFTVTLPRSVAATATVEPAD